MMIISLLRFTVASKASTAGLLKPKLEIGGICRVQNKIRNPLDKNTGEDNSGAASQLKSEEGARRASIDVNCRNFTL